MAGINKVIIVGNLGNDPEIRTMPNGEQVANITVATSESWTDKNTGERKEQVEWHRAVLYRRLAEIAGKLVRILNGNSHETDHWQDIIGYATLGGRLELAESLDNTSEPLVDILPVVNLGDKKQ